MVELLKQHGFQTPIPVHRLDRKTSGLLLFAKRASDVSAFQQLFEAQKIEKTYVALMRGHVPETGTIDSPVKNDRGNYKEALTHYRCLEHLERDFPIPPYEKQRYSIVELIPKTGRMHQLRIHANKIAHPIINDPKYGNRHHNHYFQDVLGIQELFLHAVTLCFIHPFTDQQISLNAAFPTFWNPFLTS
jgi:tRNA pseudouridine65 synthase